MKILLIYGGRGLAKDPTLIVTAKIKEVLIELSATVEQINLNEENNAKTIASNLHNYDGIVLATTVEWFGIGALAQKFLDDCWYYGDKAIIQDLYLMPVVCSMHTGERDGQNHILKSWDLLGGIHCDGICAYFSNSTELEFNKDYIEIIEKKAENLYRNIKQKKPRLPKSLVINSNGVVKENLPEKKQVSLFDGDEKYIQRQQEDIEQLKFFFKQKLESSNGDIYENIRDAFINSFVSQINFKGIYKINIIDKKKVIAIDINNDVISCDMEDRENVNVNIQADFEALEKITSGYITFQRAFMTGLINAKGDFKLLYMLDQLFRFK
ncbi:SCP-2 sterol transfer family protein [Natranaerovirga pectinivora]|uniref:SCP-2 sterol transfer family protein n=1 Tax=Natranaerovirga pectinivora TaxID=682400 RepID=A0A4R3MH71_9FIRM|nr:SCP2 sterol-binding domain-containing protein [Natranaerovirga pectinivora]TCT12934.1 SCP-2 sterol transfer family protein [Natranaerovirga pectinivora]